MQLYYSLVLGSFIFIFDLYVSKTFENGKMQAVVQLKVTLTADMLKMGAASGWLRSWLLGWLLGSLAAQ